MDSSYVSELLDRISSFDRSRLTAQTPEALESLSKLRQDVTRLGQRLEDADAKFWLLLRRSALLSPVKMAVDMGLFRLIHDANEHGKGGITSRELSKQSKADEGLIVRTLRILAAEGFVEEVGLQTYGPLPAGEPFLNPNSQATLAWALLFLPITIENPAYWAAQGYRLPGSIESHSAAHDMQVGGSNGSTSGVLARNVTQDRIAKYANPFEFHFKRPGYGLFDYTRESPEIQAIFASAMQAMRAGERAKKHSTATGYPYAEVLKENPAETALVDVAGGHGQALREIRDGIIESNSDVAGKWVLQDLQAALDEMKEGIDGVEVVANNMFEGQPVKGAAIYHLRRVLHDWDDARSLQILQHVVAAMDAKRSRVLIVDVVLPDRDASLIDALGDHSMMTFGGCERSRRQWEQLVDSAGLCLNKIWQGEEREAVIECFKN